MKLDKEKILKFLYGEVISFKIRLPVILVLYFIFIPLFAYGDAIFIGKTGFIKYVVICSFEFFLIVIGYHIRLNEERVGDKQC